MQPHFASHIAPIWKALPDDVRGVWYTIPGLAQSRAEELGIRTERLRRFRSNELVLVAGYEDYRVTRPAQVIFLNHGCGQTYWGDKRAAGMASYSGGQHRERTVLFLGPSIRDAQANAAVYPAIPSTAIGVPYLDNQLRNPDGSIAISFHANIHACPETRWAFPHYRQAITELATSGQYKILGHCHPRARRQLEPWWKSIGVEFEPNWLRVLERASIFVIDNSSTGFEAAAMGVPTIWMNAPWYRRDVHHGLRFWDMIPGPHIDQPDELLPAIKISLQTLPTPNTDAYDGLIDGHATDRAVQAICQLTTGSLTLPNHYSIT